MDRKARFFINLPLAFVLACLCATPGWTDEGWPCWRGPNGDNVSSETDWDPMAVAGKARVLWTLQVGMGYSNVAIQGGRLYTMGFTGGSNTIFCLDPASGETIWSYECEGSVEPQSTPTVDGDFVYALNKDGGLFCVDLSGRLVWRKDAAADLGAETMPYGYSTSPVVDGDLLILNLNSRGIALNKRTGETAWKSPPHGVPRNDFGYHATPVLTRLSGRRVALLVGDAALVAVDVLTGSRLWSFPFSNKSANISDPVLAGDRAFVQADLVAGECAMLQLAESGPKELWRTRTLLTDVSTAVYAGGALFGLSGSMGGRSPFRCVDPDTGAILWEKKMKSATVTACGDRLILLDDGGTLHVAKLDRSSYQEIAAGQLPRGFKWWTPPTLWHGLLYCRSFDGNLVCVDLRLKD